jgi:hypothetical protein
LKLNVERLPHAEAFEQLVPEREALDARLARRTPFTSPTWNQIWWKYLARLGPSERRIFGLHGVRETAGSLLSRH